MSSRKPDPPAEDCRVTTQVSYRGHQSHSVMAVAGQASPNGSPHVAMRVGKVLVYFESWAAVDDFGVAFSRAWNLAGQIFPQPPDAVSQLEERDRRRFERTGDVKHLRR